MRTSAAVALLFLVSLCFAQDTSRGNHLKLHWGRSLPKVPQEGEEVPKPDPDEPPPRPLLVYVRHELSTRDQNRFEDVVLKNESFLLAAKFFRCVEVPESVAEEHPLMKEIKLSPPAVVAFDSTLAEYAVAGGRASAMKIYGLLVKIGQLDYETSIAKTVRAARNHLANYDQIDAARDSLAVKQGRLENYMAKGNEKKVIQLRREIEKEHERIDEMQRKADERWTEIWKLERKKR